MLSLTIFQLFIHFPFSSKAATHSPVDHVKNLLLILLFQRQSNISPDAHVKNVLLYFSFPSTPFPPKGMSGDNLRNAAILNNLPVLQSLLKGGANPCSRDSSSLTALHFSIYNGHSNCVKLLISNGDGTGESGEECNANDLITESGYTCLHIAFLYDPAHFTDVEKTERVSIIRYLINTGQDLHALDNLNQTCRDLASQTNNQTALDMYEQYVNEPIAPHFITGFIDSENEVYNVGKKRVIDTSRCETDANGELIITRDDKLPIPLGQTMPEHFIYPDAVMNANAGRKEGAKCIRNLVGIRKEAEVNVKRRVVLANSREYEMRSQGLM